MHFCRLAAAAIALLVAIQPLRADDLPELGDVASSELSLALERRIGQQIMNEIQWREPSYLDDPDIEAYLNQLGARLVAVSPDPGMPFRFFAINDSSINAFAMPGGYIGVHTGLILAARSESELAGVLAHEIAHVTQRHIARQIYQTKKLNLASMVAMGLALLAARSSPQAASAAITTSQAGAASAKLAFSRDFERESDRLGFDMLRRAGFDVRGMAIFFDRLQQVSRGYENTATQYLRTHPLSGERMSDMQNREQSESYRQVADTPEFLLVRARARAIDGRPVDAVRDFEGLVRERKYPSLPAAHYGLAVAHGRAGNWSAAMRDLVEARRMKNAPAMVDRLDAEARFARGEHEAGLALYREAMLRFPTYLPLAYGYGSALLADRRFAEALRFSGEKMQLYPQDLRFHQMRADAHAALGQRAQHHLTLAEMSLLKGQTAGAIEQLQLAQEAGDASFQDLSVIDARLRETKRRQLEELKEKRN